MEHGGVFDDEIGQDALMLFHRLNEQMKSLIALETSIHKKNDKGRKKRREAKDAVESPRVHSESESSDTTSSSDGGPRRRFVEISIPDIVEAAYNEAQLAAFQEAEAESEQDMKESDLNVRRRSSGGKKDFLSPSSSSSGPSRPVMRAGSDSSFASAEGGGDAQADGKLGGGGVFAEKKVYDSAEDDSEGGDGEVYGPGRRGDLDYEGGEDSYFQDDDDDHDDEDGEEEAQEEEGIYADFEVDEEKMIDREENDFIEDSDVHAVRRRSQGEGSSSSSPSGRGAGDPEDEWVDDNDAGYVLERITEDEFFELEERFKYLYEMIRREDGGGNARSDGEFNYDDFEEGYERQMEKSLPLPPSDGEAEAAIEVEARAEDEDEQDFIGEDLAEYMNDAAQADESTELSSSNIGLDVLNASVSSVANALATAAEEKKRAKNRKRRQKRKEQQRLRKGQSGEAAQSPIAQKDGGVEAAVQSGKEGKGKNKEKAPESNSSGAHVAVGAGKNVEAADAAISPHLPPDSRHGSLGNIGFHSGEQDEMQSDGRTRSEIMGQRKYRGIDGDHYFFDLKVIFNPFRTGFEEDKDFNPPKGTIVAGRYEVCDVLGQAAFSTAYQCIDHESTEGEHPWVCLKVIKNSKDFFDQSLDEIKLLQYINSKGDPHKNNVLKMVDFFYCKEHLFIVSELLRENLYDFGKYVRDSGATPYFTLNRLKKITYQVLEALVYIHSLGLLHCDIKPENIVIRSYSRCEVKLIDFGSSCFETDHLTTYIQSRSYRAPEVILGAKYDFRIDIWSLGGVVAEMHTGYVLFQNDSLATMLARIIGILGPFPDAVMRNHAECSKFFIGGGNIPYEYNEELGYQVIHPKNTSLRARLHITSPEPEGPITEASSQEDIFVDFVRGMLNLDHTRRWTAKQALRHPWLRDALEVDVTYNPTQ